MKKQILSLSLAFPLFCAAQVGVNTQTPQKTLHVNGALQVVNELNVGGTSSAAGSSGLAGQVLKSGGPGVAPSWQNLAGVPNSVGTVIVVNGQFLVAQEIVVQLTADYTRSDVNATTTDRIGNLNNVIIDNENLYSGSATANSFKVTSNGVYAISMNAQLSTTNGTSPVIGIWDDTSNKWVARVNDIFAAPTGGLQTYTLITSIPMDATKTYSFRASNTASTVIRFQSFGSTGSGPITQMSMKRLK